MLFRSRPGAVVLPSWAVSYVAHVPGGAHPSYALDYSVRDNEYYVAWDAVSRDRAAFSRWLDEHVYATGGQEGKGGLGGWVPPDAGGSGGVAPPGVNPGRR